MRPNVAGFPDILSCVAADRLVRRRGIAVAQQRPKAVLSQSRRGVRVFGFPLAWISGGFFYLVGNGAKHSTPRAANVGAPRLGRHDYDA